MAAEEAEAACVRQVTADLTDVDRVAHRVAHLRTMVAGADGLQQDLGPLPASPDQERTRVEAALALAHRVLADRDDPDTGDQGRRVVDPEARCGTPGASVAGYRLDIRLDADSAWRTALNLLPGNGDEAREPQTRLAAEARAQGHAVEAVSIDGMGWNGEVWRALSAPAGRGVAVSVPPPAPAQTPWFGPEACILAAALGVVTCPGGPQTATQERRAHHTGWTCVFPRRQGAGCRQPARCLATLPQKNGRRVIKPDARPKMTPRGCGPRRPATPPCGSPIPRVERKLADRVRDHEGRRRRSRGPWRVPMPVSADRAGGACEPDGDAAAPAGGAAGPADTVIFLVQGNPRGGSSRQAPPTDLVVPVPLDGEGGLAELRMSEAACGWSLARINDF